MELLECFFYFFLMRGLYDEHNESTTTCTRHFSSFGTRSHSYVHSLLNHRIGNVIGHLLFIFPTFAENIREAVYVSFQNGQFHILGTLFYLVHSFNGIVLSTRGVLFLLLDNSGTTTRLTGKEQQHTGFQFINNPALNLKRIDNYHIILQKFHVVESSESCRILILLATREIQILTLYLVG